MENLARAMRLSSGLPVQNIRAGLLSGVGGCTAPASPQIFGFMVGNAIEHVAVFACFFQPLGLINTTHGPTVSHWEKWLHALWLRLGRPKRRA